ncbi:hypothetical protein [Achromobacter sp. 2789STDY5608628]|uniref:hypothetical protein n=1 Tax=Achromobacter sp. 2789STDY5608628 TaxID=1806493 RepID=UPI0006BFB7BE|nr:hypothetical protein [Achromobacter sp. 2789STDY5608628]CUJ67218.1 Uncharacterised protein [Achromobacter sp. 2789STDY5608628]
MAAGAITFDKFDLGIDRRKGASVSDANRLLEMKNAYVTTGLATQKRPGLVKVTTLEPGTKGLFAGLGVLNTFYSQTNVTHADPRFKAHKVEIPLSPVPLAEVWFADVFNGAIYVSVEYEDGRVWHHYLDGTTPTYIEDAQNPSAKAVIKMASKIFAVHNDTVRYCATNKPRDWSTANDAGFLPTGLNMQGDRTANALGDYQGNLVVMARDGLQVWNVDPDPSAMKLAPNGKVPNVGTSYPRSVANVSGDLYFLSDFGFRSITTLQYTNNLADVDVGSPIDSLVVPDIRQANAVPKAFFHYGTGQYICVIGSILYVYSVSRTAKIAAWSRYYIPFQVDAFAELNGELYFRNGDDIYRFTADAHDDAGTPFEVLLQLPYMDLKAPGQMKRIFGADIVMEGECTFSVAFDVRNPDAYTPPVRVRGNTRPGGVIPVECSGTEFSLIFRNLSSKPFRLDAVTLYFESLGAI